MSYRNFKKNWCFEKATPGKVGDCKIDLKGVF